jgi:hypothetical protein
MAAIFLTMAGVYGVGHGVEALAGPRSVPVTQETNAELREAMHLLQANPSAAALGAINIVVSVMLIVSSMLITMRRASAMWFVRQAIVANLLFIAARFAVDVSYLWSLGSALDAVGRDAYERSLDWFPEAAPPPNFTSMTRAGMLFSQLLVAGLSGSLHLYLGWKSTRPAVRAFIEVGPKAR